MFSRVVEEMDTERTGPWYSTDFFNLLGWSGELGCLVKQELPGFRFDGRPGLL